MSDCCNNFDFVSQQSSFDMSGGIRGADGTTFYPHVSADGVLSWTNDGGKPNPSPVNIKGADGKSAYAAAVEAGFIGTEAEFGTYLSGIGDLTQEVADQKSAIEEIDGILPTKAGIIRDTVSGSPATFYPDATVPNLLSVTVDIEYVQAGSGEPSPTDNVRPISGWDSVDIWNKPTHDTTLPPTVTIQLGQTVYGGTLTVNEDGSADMLASVEGRIFDGVTYQATLNSGNIYWIPAPHVNKWQQPLACSHCPIRASSVGISGANAANRFWVYWNGTTAADLNAFFAAQLSGGTPFAVVWRSNSPTTIHIDNISKIKTIPNQTNNVWADAGNVSVTYAADIKAYIDRLNQPAEDDMIANALIASGKYFTVNNRLFLSTASIAAGAQIIPGTNCTETSLAAALNAINA